MNSIVVPDARSSWMRCRHLIWNSASPTARTSSTSRTSGDEMGGDGEPQPHVHARRVPLDRRVDERLDAGEVDDLVELRCDLARAACRESRH